MNDAKETNEEKVDKKVVSPKPKQTKKVKNKLKFIILEKMSREQLEDTLNKMDNIVSTSLAVTTVFESQLVYSCLVCYE